MKTAIQMATVAASTSVFAVGVLVSIPLGPDRVRAALRGAAEIAARRHA